MHDKNEDTKSFAELRKYLQNEHFFWQYCKVPYLEPNQKSMVELFCKNGQQLFAVNFCFAKKPHWKCYTVLPVKKKETN